MHALAFNRETLPFRTNFLIAGTQCLLRTNSRDIFQAAENRWPTTRYSQLPCFEMEVLVDSALERTAEPGAYFRGVRHLVFAALPPHSFLTYDLLRRRVHAVLSTAAARNSSFWNRMLLPITIGVLGTTVGVVPLHCACLDRNGSGLLITGVSGAGKSTLAAALTERGFAFISDDWTYIGRQDSELVGHGLFSPMKLLPDTVRFFPDLRRCMPRMTLNGELAYEVDPERSKGFTVRAISHPRRIFFLERSSTPGCSMVPCRREYVLDFFERSAERLPDELPGAKAFRTSILQSLSALPAWFLRTGESPQGTAAAIEEFLSEASYAAG